MLHVLRAYVGISYCKTDNFNYTNFRVYVQVPALNINHPAVIFFLVLLTMTIIMSMLVIVMFFVLRLVLFLGE